MPENLQASEAHLSDYFKIIKKQKAIIIVFFCVVVATVTAASLLMIPIYRSTVTLLIDQEGSSVLTTSGNVSIGTPDYYAYKEYFQSQQSMITSRQIIKKVFDEFNLKDAKKYKKSVDPISDFLKTIKVEAIRDTRLLQLHVDDKDPVLAAKIANRIAEIYVQRNLVYISKSEAAELLKNEYLRLQAKLGELSKIYKDKHPQIIRLKQEIKDMVSRIEGQTTPGTDNFGISEDILIGLKANNISVQDWAEPNVKPIRPKKRLNVLLAIFAGLFGGIGLAFFFEYLDDSVKNAEDTQKIFPWTFLGYILDIGKTANCKKINKDLFVHHKPKDPVAEAYRTIRTSISFLSTDGHPLKCIAITSPRPKEGKTVTSCNLSIIFAQNHERVLIVDADMRKSRLHNTFGAKNDKGLANYLINQTSFDEIVHQTEIPNLSICPCGPHPPNPSELLSSQRMKNFIKEAKDKFDFIIIDTPPIAIVTDSIILSRLVDQTIIVLESEKTSTRVLPRINQMLKNSKAENVSFLINKKLPSMRRKYDYYYAASSPEEDK
ncbi:MAG: polysaccharide biosynthesis tyrosine autokinase [Candidatus Aceula meridiana]|nr:polysaccharide biosynthesis tyrosine autokinase [Candidatus Aceula meridiana]